MKHKHSWKINTKMGQAQEGSCRCGAERVFTNETTHYRNTNRMSGTRASVKARREQREIERIAEEAR